MTDRHYARRLAVALGLSLLLHAWLMRSHYGKGMARGGESEAIAARITLAGVDAVTTVNEAAASTATTPGPTVERVIATEHTRQAISEPVVHESALTDAAKSSSPAPSQPSDPAYYTAGDLDVFPRALVKPDLNAALAATRESAAGKVRATVLIDEAGTVNAVRSVEAAQDIEAVVRDLLLRTRFTPARNKEGRIVKAQLLVALDYDTRVVPMAR